LREGGGVTRDERMLSYDEVYGAGDDGTASAIPITRQEPPPVVEIRERRFERHDNVARSDVGWERPVPLDRRFVLPAFPTDALPAPLARFVGCVAHATQTPEDLAGMMVLGALAAAAGGRAVAVPRSGWREPLNLFVATAMAPGNRKSAVVQEVTRPLRVAERMAIDAIASEVATKRNEREIAMTRAKDMQRKAARDDDEVDESEAAAAMAMAEQITVPVIPRLLADDCTPEALSTIMSEQGGRVAVVSAEGGIFDIIAGKYSKMPSFDVFLKGHAGDEIRVDRVGRKPEHIESPALTLALAVQPAVLRAIVEREGFRGRGLLARFMFVLPTSFVGMRDVGADPVPDGVRDDYDQMMQALVLTLAEWTDPAVLMFTPEANVELLAFERRLEPELGPGGQLEHLADWGSKLAGATVRVAGLLHLAERLKTGYREPISADTFRRP
jgi:replicative DNA helicase